MATTADTEVGVFPQETSVLFVDTNDVLDNERCAVVLHKRTRLQTTNRQHSTRKRSTQRTYEVVNLAKTVASERQLVRHRTHTVLSRIERKLARMRVLGGGVRDDHLCQGKTIDDRTHDTIVVIRDRRKHDTFPVMERYSHTTEHGQ